MQTIFIFLYDFGIKNEFVRWAVGGVLDKNEMQRKSMQVARALLKA